MPDAGTGRHINKASYDPHDVWPIVILSVVIATLAPLISRGFNIRARCDGLADGEHRLLVRSLDGSGRCFFLPDDELGGPICVTAVACPDHEIRASTLNGGGQ